VRSLRPGQGFRSRPGDRVDNPLLRRRVKKRDGRGLWVAPERESPDQFHPRFCTASLRLSPVCRPLAARRPAVTASDSPISRAFVVGETGFEPATARPPGGSLLKALDRRRGVGSCARYLSNEMPSHFTERWNRPTGHPVYREACDAPCRREAQVSARDAFMPMRRHLSTQTIPGQSRSWGPRTGPRPSSSPTPQSRRPQNGYPSSSRVITGRMARAI